MCLLVFLSKTLQETILKLNQAYLSSASFRKMHLLPISNQGRVQGGGQGGHGPPLIEKMGGLRGHGPPQSKNGRRKKLRKREKKTYPQDSKVRPFGAKIKLEFGRLP